MAEDTTENTGDVSIPIGNGEIQNEYRRDLTDEVCVFQNTTAYNEIRLQASYNFTSCKFFGWVQKC